MEIYKENSGSNRGGSLGVLNLLERRCLAPINFNSGGNGSGTGSDDGEEIESLLSRKLLYRKLPQQRHFKLSVLKLDGSLFDVNVGRNATVAELKVAIEELFAELPEETNGCISWNIRELDVVLVGHMFGGTFACLMMVRNWLTTRLASKTLGSKMLQFIRHISVNQSPLKRRLKHHGKCSPSGSGHEKRQNVVNHNDLDENKDDNSSDHYIEEEEIPLPEVKLTRLLSGWLSSTKLWAVSRKGSQGRNHRSRLTLKCLKG
ncbi:hypothetical protein COLO4_11937 [Corchorus olitorius]|uniref:SNRNP25 ubiquitin-like domain-containing protein n=1 Tax=Corchorus olitorius TaxID=93759 RepID=A0A1R3K2R3_9ROSI|nr:hypothetical protein COLO4_11937 [Corchorus olitorius]